MASEDKVNRVKERVIISGKPPKSAVVISIIFGILVSVAFLAVFYYAVRTKDFFLADMIIATLVSVGILVGSLVTIIPYLLRHNFKLTDRHLYIEYYFRFKKVVVKIPLEKIIKIRLNFIRNYIYGHFFKNVKINTQEGNYFICGDYLAKGLTYDYVVTASKSEAETLFREVNKRIASNKTKVEYKRLKLLVKMYLLGVVGVYLVPIVLYLLFKLNIGATTIIATLALGYCFSYLILKGKAYPTVSGYTETGSQAKFIGYLLLGATILFTIAFIYVAFLKYF